MERSIRELVLAAGAEELLESWTHKPGASIHYMGTCRMGNDPRTSVVNRWGRTHEVSNLFIADSSVFVTGAAAHPTLTLMALASRTADFLIEAFRQGEFSS
jgi:choline dehydrogenase-like flavoprotein